MGRLRLSTSKVNRRHLQEQDLKMALEINWRPEVGKKVEEFFDDPSYKEYLESAVSFNRKLNEERKMRLPYIDSQTGVAQRHYNSQRHNRERMPGLSQGQIYSYPQKQWRKKKYQYLKYFMQPKKMFDHEAEMHTISQVENPSATGRSSSIPPNEDSNTSGGPDKDNWPYYDEDGFMDDGEAEGNSDSDFEYEDSYSRKRKSTAGGGKRGGSSRGSKGGSKVSFGSVGGPGPMSSSTNNSSNKRRTHADNIPDSEKPFSCERTPPGRPSLRRPGGISYGGGEMFGGPGGSRDDESAMMPSSQTGPRKIMVDGKERAAPSGYCDFCLGDRHENKKTNKPEDMVSCAECGRSGHPTCLQFTDNMIISVKKYPWQCIECKTCTLCGTSENDDQLLFCDDCDRGYHMYCLVPPIKEPPEGSWSCNLCIENFHRKPEQGSGSTAMPV